MVVLILHGHFIRTYSQKSLLLEKYYNITTVYVRRISLIYSIKLKKMIEKNKFTYCKVMHPLRIDLVEKNSSIIFTKSCIHPAGVNLFPLQTIYALFLDEPSTVVFSTINTAVSNVTALIKCFIQWYMTINRYEKIHHPL